MPASGDARGWGASPAAARNFHPTRRMPDADPPRRERALIANDTARAVTVVLAPWAAEHALAPDDAVVVEARGPAGAHAELLIERTCDTAVVWAWAGAESRLLTPDGRVLVDWVGGPPGGAA